MAHGRLQIKWECAERAGMEKGMLERTSNMQFEMLENNIIDMIEEQQLKLGYLDETVRLYYPLSSLNRFLNTEDDEEMMTKHLEQFANEVENRLGKIDISHKKDRFCVAVPPIGAKYVHDRLNTDGFLAKFIATVGKHGCTLDDVFAVFHAYSDCVHIEKVDNGEFDYLVYFEDGKPDDYRYCITNEMCHVIYHRYTKADYEDFGF